MSDRARWAGRELDYEFNDLDLLEQALTHRSASRRNNERLEFLGDAMLGASVAAMLYARHPEASEGDLSRLRAALVNRRTLAGVGRRIGIDGELVLGSGELATGGAHRESALADAVEAVIGAVALDGGREAADRLVKRLLGEALEALPDAAALKDSKTRLQERLQGRGLDLPVYTVEGVSGRDHNRVFAVSCAVAQMDLVVSGRGSSRRRAEQAAAEAMLLELRSRDG